MNVFAFCRICCLFEASSFSLSFFQFSHWKAWIKNCFFLIFYLCLSFVTFIHVMPIYNNSSSCSIDNNRLIKTKLYNNQYTNIFIRMNFFTYFNRISLADFYYLTNLYKSVCIRNWNVWACCHFCCCDCCFCFFKNFVYTFCDLDC